MIYVKRNGVTVLELLSIVVPDSTRPASETTTASNAVQTNLMGLLRRGSLSFEINYVAFVDLTHQGLLDAMLVQSEDVYEFSDGGDVQTSYGLVESFKFQGLPVDGVVRVRVSVLLIAEPPNLLIQEDSGGLLTEDFVDLELDL